MEVISSGQTFFIKKVFPALWMAIIGFVAVAGVVNGQAWKQPQIILLPVIMVLFGFFLFRKLIWDIADDVRDGGSFLLVRKGSVEERVSLDNVMNVSMSQFTNPRRVSLRLRKPGMFGDEIVFIPKSTFQLNPFARNPVAEKLMARVDQLRIQGQGSR
jgi:hypothetical protein